MKTIYLTLSLSLIMIAVLITLSASFKKAETESSESIKESVGITTEENRQVMAHEVTETDMTESMVTTSEAPVAETVTSSENNAGNASVLPEFVSPTSGYLMKAHSGDTPVFSPTMNDYRPHVGVDLSAGVGDDVYAVAAGVISEIWEDPMSGTCMSIAHDGDAVSIYRNLSSTLPDSLKVGSTVSVGEVIASVGESSLLEIADEGHLHFELTVNGEQVDPAKYIMFDTIDTNYEG